MDYLAYGKTDNKYIDVGSKFDIELCYDEKYENDILKAFYYFSRFGSLGSKSRNGYGNFIVNNETDVFNNIDNPELIDELPRYTAFSTKSKLFKLNTTFESWDKCLFEIGSIYLKARVHFKNQDLYNRKYLGTPFKKESKRRTKPYFIRLQKDEKGYTAYLLYLPAEFMNSDKNKNKEFLDVNKDFQQHLKTESNKSLKEIDIEEINSI